MSDERAVEGQDQDDAPSTEEQTERIEAIVGDEVLGYEGAGREEHSGQSAPDDAPGTGKLGDGLADNRPDQVK